MSFYDEILAPVFGSKPQVAGFTPLDLQEEQKKSILGNIANFDDIAKLGELYRKNFIEEQEALLPGFSENLKKGSEATGKLLDLGEEFLTGELPQDVQDQIYRNSAYKAFRGGYGGSQMHSGLTARDFGLNSLDLMKQGADMIGRGGNSAQQWSAMAKGGMMNPAASFIDPNFQATFDLQNRQLEQNAKQFAYNVEAAPDPVAAGISNTLMSVLGMYAGGGFGGGSGGLAQGGKTAFNVNAGMGYG